MNITQILVPLDGSALAQAALVPALELARKYGARLLLMRAAEAHTPPMADPIDAQVAAVREAEQYLAGVRDQVKRAGATDVDVSVWYGAPAQAIVEAAKYRKADLIVMSTHGRSGIGRLVLGSVAEKVLRATAVPILLLRPGAAPLDTSFEDAPAATEVTHG
jgi:nucleotide-binding universal stress UspA family protein